MADGDIVNDAMKEFLRSAGAKNRQTRKKADDIIKAVLVSVKATASNTELVTTAVISLLEDYSSMVASGKDAAIRTANDVNGYWLDVKNLNANAFTDFACGLSASRSAVEEVVASMAESPFVAASLESTVAPPSAIPTFEESIPGPAPLTTPQASHAPDDCCQALRSALFLYEKKILSLESFLEAIRAIPQRCCA